MTPMTCDELSEAAAELALGTLSGADRARALHHLQTCASCRAEVEELASVSDALLELVPGADPPLGFETRVAARISRSRAAAPRPVRPWARAALAAAAAVVLGIGGFAVGAVTHPSSTPPATAALASAPLTAGGTTVGHVFVYSGQPNWVYMSIDVGHGDGPVTCVLTRGDGSTVRLGTFNLTMGYGYWGAPLPSGGGYTGARLVDSAGATVASAVVSA